MKTKGVVRFIDGVPYTLSFSKKQAELENVAYYLDFCPTCTPYQRSKFHTTTGECVTCTKIKVAKNFNELMKNGCYPTNPEQANIMGYDFYLTPEPNKHCGHDGKVTLAGKCYECSSAARELSPRQIALSRGDAWYTPVIPCQHCGEIALRRVANGECKGCSDKRTTNRPPKAPQPYEQFPEMVIDRAAAQAVGFKVFRTGKPCCNGHTSWRYVSTGTCLACMGRV